MLGILRPASPVQLRTSVYTRVSNVGLRLLEVGVAICRKPVVALRCMLLGQYG